LLINCIIKIKMIRKNIKGLSYITIRTKNNIRDKILRRLEGKFWKWLTKDFKKYSREYAKNIRVVSYYGMYRRWEIAPRNLKEERVFTISDRKYLKKITWGILFKKSSKELIKN